MHYCTVWFPSHISLYLWSTAQDLWSAAQDLWSAAQDLWSAAQDPWSTAQDLWSAAQDLWSAAQDLVCPSTHVGVVQSHTYNSTNLMLSLLTLKLHVHL